MYNSWTTPWERSQPVLRDDQPNKSAGVVPSAFYIHSLFHSLHSQLKNSISLIHCAGLSVQKDIATHPAAKRLKKKKNQQTLFGAWYAPQKQTTEQNVDTEINSTP